MVPKLTLRHIYIYAVKLLSGPSLAFWGVIIWSKVGSLSGPSLFSHCKNRVSSDVFLLSYHFVFFCAQLSGNFLNIAFFKKRVQKLVFFFFFLCFKFEILKFSFLGLLKHYKIWGFSKFRNFFVEREESRQKMIIGISGFGFFGPKMAISWRISFIQKKEKAETPIFIVFWGCALFGPSCQKRKFGHPPKKEKFDWSLES